MCATRSPSLLILIKLSMSMSMSMSLSLSLSLSLSMSMSMSMIFQAMSRASVAKECYEAHCQPWSADQVEEESIKKVVFILVILINNSILIVVILISFKITIMICNNVTKASAELTAEERIEQLRKTTEEMITSRTEYVESTRLVGNVDNGGGSDEDSDGDDDHLD